MVRVPGLVLGSSSKPRQSKRLSNQKDVSFKQKYPLAGRNSGGHVLPPQSYGRLGSGQHQPGEGGSKVISSVQNQISSSFVDQSNPVEVLEAVSSSASLLEGLKDKWSSLPHHRKLVAATSLAFVVCNMDKVNMSIAIIPMAQEFGWHPAMSGLVQSSFFWGYLLCQLPGGYLCSKFSGRSVMPLGVGMWSAATASLPILAGSLPGLVFSRALVGMGEAVAPSAATDMVARTVPAGERSRAIAFVFGGLHVGSVLGLVVSPILIDNFGWPSVFVAFGGAGLAWVGWFQALLGNVKAEDPEFYSTLLPSNTAFDKSNPYELEDHDIIPWRAILRSNPVRALGFAHFCNNWFSYSMLAWLPSYFSDTLKLDLSQAAQVSLLPPLAGILVSCIAGPSADFLVNSGWKTAVVRKLFQCMAFLGPCAALAGAMQHQDDGLLNIGFVSLALGLSSFSLGGLYCNHQDLSPRYSSFLLGLTNTWAAVPGIVGVLMTGFILENTGSWPAALFAPSMVFFLAGSVVYCTYGTSDPQAFDNDNPFVFENNIVSTWGALLAKSSRKVADE